MQALFFLSFLLMKPIEAQFIVFGVQKPLLTNFLIFLCSHLLKNLIKKSNSFSMRLVQGKPAGTLIERILKNHSQAFIDLINSETPENKRLIINQIMLMKMKEFFLKNKFEGFFLKIAPSTYYDWSLEERAEFLQAPSIKHLCKTMIMNNRNFQKEKGKERTEFRKQVLCAQCLLCYQLY